MKTYKLLYSLAFAVFFMSSIAFLFLSTNIMLVWVINVAGTLSAPERLPLTSYDFFLTTCSFLSIVGFMWMFSACMKLAQASWKKIAEFR